MAERVSGLVSIVDLETRKVIATADPRGPDHEPYGSKDTGVSLFVAPAGQRFVLLSDRPELLLFNFAGKELKKYALPSIPNGAAFTPDGKTLVTANADGSLYVIDLP